MDRKAMRRRKLWRRRLRRYVRILKYNQRRLFVLLCGVMLLIILGCVIGEVRTVSFASYYGEGVLFANPTYSTKAELSNIKYENNEIYLPFELVKEYIDSNIYRSDEGDRIIITTDESVVRMRSEDNNAYVNGSEMALNVPIYDTDYLPASVLERFYPVKLTYNETNSTVTLTFTDRESYDCTIRKRTYLKYEPTRTSLRVRRLKKGETVNALMVNEDYTFVTTSDGLCGYVASSSFGEITIVNRTQSIPKAKTLWTCSAGKANIVFDQVTNAAANTNYDRIPIKDGVDVICPTWFSFENTSGDIKNLADRAYVDAAHNKDIAVWALLTDNFDGAVSHAVLANADTREYVIKQLLAYSALYDLDGINIDFEAVQSQDGELFVQFLRELAPMLHNEGVILSADFFVPKAWTQHYNRGKCAEVLDYLIVMGYDQHTSGSTEAGSNAELSWSEEAITATLAQDVPKQKLLLGIPFYTRVWTTDNSTGELSQQAMGMKAAKDFMTEKGGIIKWNETAGQNYAEISDSTSTYKCWFEDADSVTGRLSLVNKYDIAGTAAWKSGLETDDIWSVLKNGLKGQA